MNAVLEELLAGYTSSPSGDVVQVRDAIGRQKGEFLQELILELRPVVSLEVGLAHGVSALFICDALSKTANARHIVIDPYQDRFDMAHRHLQEDGYRGIGLHNLSRAGYGDMIEFYDEPSYRVLPRLEEQGRKIDFAFIDGWHTFDYALVDFFYIDKMLDVGGMVVFDDANWPAIRKVIRYVVRNLAYSARSMNERDNLSKKQLIVERVVSWSNRVSRNNSKLRRLLTPELIETDAKLGLWSGCIGLTKEADDRQIPLPELHRTF
jgi:predicted O-methyltransferase YrrM